MKKITLRSLAFLLALLMALMCAFVGCAEVEEDDDDDKDDKKSENITVTKENAEEILVKAYENLADATYFSGKSTNTETFGDGESYGCVIDFTVANDEKIISMLAEKNHDGEEAAAEKYYYINNEKFECYDGDYEYCLLDDSYDISEIFNIIFNDMFMLEFEDIAEKFCLADYEIIKKDGTYTLELAIDTYEDFIKLFVSDGYYDEMAEYIEQTEGNGILRFALDKKGNLSGVYLEETSTFDGETTNYKYDVVFEDVNADKKLEEPDWVADREYGKNSCLYQVENGIEYSYSYTDGELCFDGAYSYDYEETSEVEYYKLLSEIDGQKVKYLTGNTYITIKNLVVPEGVSFLEDSYIDLEDTYVYFEGEYDADLDTDINVKGIYRKDEWSYVEGVPTPDEGVVPSVPGDDIPGDDVDDIIDGIDESAKFVGDWESVVDISSVFSGLIDVMLGEMADYFDFSDFELKMYITFNEDGTYRTSVDETYMNAYINGLKDEMKDGFRAYLTDAAIQAGYSSVDKFCMDNTGMTVDAYLDSVIGNMDVEEMLPAEDLVNEGRYVAKSGKIYMTIEGQETINANSYNKYVFADDGLSFNILAPDLEDLGDLEEGYEELYSIMLQIFPMTFTKTNR